MFFMRQAYETAGRIVIRPLHEPEMPAVAAVVGTGGKQERRAGGISMEWLAVIGHHSSITRTAGQH